MLAPSLSHRPRSRDRPDSRRPTVGYQPERELSLLYPESRSWRFPGPASSCRGSERDQLDRENASDRGSHRGTADDRLENRQPSSTPALRESRAIPPIRPAPRVRQRLSPHDRRAGSDSSLQSTSVRRARYISGLG